MINFIQAAGGAAMRINRRSRVTFTEDVTFSGCSLPVRIEAGVMMRRVDISVA